MEPAQKRALQAVPVFIGGLRYSWRKGEGAAAETMVDFLRRESDHERIRVEISSTKKSAIAYFEGYGPWPFQAVLRLLEVTMRSCSVFSRKICALGYVICFFVCMAAGRMSNDIRFAEIKPHNLCDFHSLKRWAEHASAAELTGTHSPAQASRNPLHNSHQTEQREVKAVASNWPDEAWSRVLLSIEPTSAWGCKRMFLYRRLDECAKSCQIDNSSASRGA